MLHCDDNPVHLDRNSEFLHTPPEIFELISAKKITFVLIAPAGELFCAAFCLEQFLARMVLQRESEEEDLSDATRN